MTESYTSGIWIVKESEEDAFVGAWKAAASRQLPARPTDVELTSWHPRL